MSQDNNNNSKNNDNSTTSAVNNNFEKNQKDTQSTNQKKKKTKGPIRWEAIVPFTIILVLLLIYFKLFFDSNLKSAMEFAGYHATGAEVNIAKLETSFLKASIRIQGVELTNAEKPTHNSLNIGDIRFSLLWDALLRVKFVVNEVAIENISFNQKRKHIGKVKPVDPEKESALKKEAEKLKDEAINKTKDEYQDNVLGNIANMMSGSNENNELEKLKSKIVSKEKIKKFEEDLKVKQKDWEERLKKLPKSAEFQKLGDDLKKVKTSNFKDIQELNQSVQEIQKILDEGNKKFAEVTSAKNDLDKDLKLTDDELKSIKIQIEKDIKDLEAHFKIPKIDAKSIAMSLFKRYTNPYFAKINHYKNLFYKYAPPNLVKKDKDEPDLKIQPRQRDRGITYEFGHPNSYPLFWIKQVKVSSKAGAMENSGNLVGEINNITSNQLLIKKPTTAELSGDFPSENIMGIKMKLLFDNMNKDSRLSFDFIVDSYPLKNIELVQSEDVTLGFLNATGSVNTQAELVAYKNLNLKLNNTFKQINYNISAKNKDVESVLKSALAEANTTQISAFGKGQLPSFDLDIESNLGDKIQKGFEKVIQAKINEAKKKVNDLIQAEIGKQKELLEKQVNQFKGQAEGEIKKIQAQAENQKKVAESKVDEAKKDFERRADAEKKKVEGEAKKKAEDELKKAAEDLKKKFGF